VYAQAVHADDARGRKPVLVVVPFALGPGGGEDSSWARAVVRTGELVSDEAGLALTKTDAFQVLDLGQQEASVGSDGQPLQGLLSSSALRQVSAALEARFVLMAQVTRQASLAPNGNLVASLDLRLVLYDHDAQALISDGPLSVRASAKGVKPPQEGDPVAPAALLQALWRGLRRQIVERVIDVTFPIRVSEIREDGVVTLDGGEGLHLRRGLLLDVFEDPAQTSSVGVVRVEFVGDRTSAAQALRGRVDEGFVVRTRGTELAVTAVPPDEVEAGADAASGTSARPTFLPWAVAAVVALMCVPLLITMWLERRQPKRTGVERIRVSETVSRKRKRAGAQAWQARFKTRDAGSTLPADARRSPRGKPLDRRGGTAWHARVEELKAGRGLKVHAVGESSEDLSVDDMQAMAAEAPAGSFAYAPAQSRFRLLVDDAWGSGESSRSGLIPPAQPREPAGRSQPAPQDEPAPASAGDGGEPWAPSPRTKPSPPRGSRPSAAARRLDALLDD
jgi:hypothetical protein